MAFESSDTVAVAYKRITDNVPRVLDLRLVQAMPRQVFDDLVRALRLADADAHERCKRLLAEDGKLVARRAELNARKRRLGELSTQFRAFLNGV